MLFILIAGSATLLWQLQNRQQSQAAFLDAGNVIGPPSLPAATVDSIFARMGSPMADTGKVVEQAARATNIDDAFALGVWWTETNDGEAGVGLADRNPGSVRGSYGYPSAYDGYTVYPSYAAAIIDWFNVLKSRYVSQGLTSAYSICYPYVGTASSLQWAYKVVNLMISYRDEAPPPTPIVTPTVNPTLRMHKQMGTQVIIAQKHVQAEQGQQQESAKPVSTQASTTQQATAATLPRGTEIALMTLGLLAALAIALLGLWFKRAMPQEQVVQAQAIQTAMSFAPNFNFGTTEALIPPLFVNQYSPVLEHREQETEQLPFPVEVDAFSAFHFGYSDDSYSQRNTEALPRRITLRPLATSEGERHTSLLGHEERTARVVPQPVPVASSPQRGLLARYGNHAEDVQR